MNIPAVMVVAIGNWVLLPVPPTEAESFKVKLERIDLIGMLVFVGAQTSFLFGLTAGGVLYQWKSVNVILPLIFGIIGIVIFYWIEEYFAKEPMVPMRVFKQRTALAAYIGTWAQGIILWSLIYYLLLWVRPLLRAN